MRVPRNHSGISGIRDRARNIQELAVSGISHSGIQELAIQELAVLEILPATLPAILPATGQRDGDARMRDEQDR